MRKLSENKDFTVGVGILSWKSPLTLEKSLKSYQDIDFKDFFDQSKIIFQETSQEDIKLADKYGYEFVKTEENLGIQRGHELIYENVKTDYILVLENDNPSVEDKANTFNRISKALELIENNTIDIMRLRHRWKFGEAFSCEKYLRYHRVQNLHQNFCDNEKLINETPIIVKLRSLLRPSKALRLGGYGIYYEKDPHKIFPEYIKMIDDEIFSVDSYIMNWTNQSVLIKRELYGKLLEFARNNPSTKDANGFQDLEKPLNCKWWREQHFKIGVGEGIFTHNRFDDSWRKGHHAFNKDTKQ